MQARLIAHIKGARAARRADRLLLEIAAQHAIGEAVYTSAHLIRRDGASSRPSPFVILIRLDDRHFGRSTDYYRE